MGLRVILDLLEKVLQLELDAAKFGFCWENAAQIMEQIQSECLEVNEHLSSVDGQRDEAALQEEIGDLLHAVFSLCVFCKLNPKETLKKTVEKFERRMLAVKAIAVEEGFKHLEGFSFDALMVFWEKAKLRVG